MLTTTFWEKYFTVYDNLNQLTPYRDLLIDIIYRLNIDKDDNVLDLGSGTGNLSLIISKYTKNICGVDSSDEGIKICKMKVPNMMIYQSDIINRLPFTDSSFDKICTNNTIYTIKADKRQDIFNELYRLLKPGGIIVTSNIHTKFNPLTIYYDHIKISIRENGFWATLTNSIKMIIPTVKIFYYNLIIKNNIGDFELIKPNEQRELLLKSGFVSVSKDLYTYSGQAILNYATK